MKVNIGFSSCPNDTFIFDGLLHGKVDTEGLEFEAVIADVEELNQRAFRAELAITKLSYHAFAYLADKYVLLDAGSALGNNCGPLLIAKKAISREEMPHRRIAIPGRYTTANFLLGLAYPTAQNKVELLFSDIESAILEGKVDAGVIIHENRFTYQQKGLMKIIDLGAFWEEHTGHPIPLGGIAIRRDLPRAVQQRVNRVLSRSVAYAMAHPEETYDFVRHHAQEMERSVMYQHIQLYVNEYTKELGAKGKKAVQQLFEMAESRNLIPAIEKPLFLSRDEKAFR